MGLRVCAGFPPEAVFRERWRCNISARIFVGNLNFQTTEFELRELLAEIGELTDLYLATDRMTGRSRGFAFATFATDDQAAEAIERFNGHELDGRNLNVNEAEDRPRRGPRGGGGGFNDDFGGGGGGGGGFGGGKKPYKAKGSRRGLRARKRGF